MERVEKREMMLTIIEAEVYNPVKALFVERTTCRLLSGPLLWETRPPRSVSGRFADFVVNLWEGLLTAELLSEFVVEPSVKHVPKLFSTHVNVGIQHLEPV